MSSKLALCPAKKFSGYYKKKNADSDRDSATLYIRVFLLIFRTSSSANYILFIEVQTRTIDTHRVNIIPLLFGAVVENLRTKNGAIMKVASAATVVPSETTAICGPHWLPTGRSRSRWMECFRNRISSERNTYLGIWRKHGMRVKCKREVSLQRSRWKKTLSRFIHLILKSGVSNKDV